MRRPNSLNHKIWGIAWPAILSNISVPLLGLVDAAILGHLADSNYLAAVAIGSALLSFLYWGFSFLRMGTTGWVAKATGAGDSDGAALVLAQSALLALVLAAVVLLLHPQLLALGFVLMAPGSELLPIAESYTRIRIASAPAVLVTYALVGWFIGRQNTRWAMYIALLTNALNIALDFLFIVGWGWGSDGAAFATLIAEYCGCALALYGLKQQLPAITNSALWQQLRSLGSYRKLLYSNAHLFVRTVSLLFSLAFFTAMGNRMGADVVAANAILIQLAMLASYGMDGFAYAAEGLCGERLGARDLSGFRNVVRHCAYWCAGTATSMSLFFLIAEQPLFALMTDLSEVRQLLAQYHLWLVAMPLAAAASYLLDGVFIGSAETRYMMWTMLFSLLIIYLPLWWLTQNLGNHGLWLAFIAFNLCRGVSLYWVYRRLSLRHLWLPPHPK